jgi:hypothetical protein
MGVVLKVLKINWFVTGTSHDDPRNIFIGSKDIGDVDRQTDRQTHRANT